MSAGWNFSALFFAAKRACFIAAPLMRGLAAELTGGENYCVFADIISPSDHSVGTSHVRGRY